MNKPLILSIYSLLSLLRICDYLSLTSFFVENKNEQKVEWMDVKTKCLTFSCSQVCFFSLDLKFLFETLTDWLVCPWELSSRSELKGIVIKERWENEKKGGRRCKITLSCHKKWSWKKGAKWKMFENKREKSEIIMKYDCFKDKLNHRSFLLWKEGESKMRGDSKFKSSDGQTRDETKRKRTSIPRLEIPFFFLRFLLITCTGNECRDQVSQQHWQ